MIKIQAVLFDLIGTTVKENDPNTIMNCFEKAFFDNQIVIDRDLIRANRGKDKLEMIDLIVKRQGLSADYAARVHTAFKINFTKSIDSFITNTGTFEIVDFLRDRKIKIGIGTGLPRDLFEKIVKHLNWSRNMFDYIGIGNELGRPRPYPDMIYDMMLKLNLFNKTAFLKIGDTEADIEEGKNAGIMTAALLAGTQPDQMLRNAEPDFILSTLTDLRKIISE